MERLNLEGGDPAPRVMRPKCLSLSELGNLEVDHLVDVREPLAFASGHLPESMNLPVGMISAFAGWLFREGERNALVASDEDQLEEAKTHLPRTEEHMSELQPLMHSSYAVLGWRKKKEETRTTP